METRYANAAVVAQKDKAPSSKGETLVKAQLGPNGETLVEFDDLPPTVQEHVVGFLNSPEGQDQLKQQLPSGSPSKDEAAQSAAAPETAMSFEELPSIVKDQVVDFLKSPEGQEQIKQQIPAALPSGQLFRSGADEPLVNGKLGPNGETLVEFDELPPSLQQQVVGLLQQQDEKQKQEKQQQQLQRSQPDAMAPYHQQSVPQGHPLPLVDFDTPTDDSVTIQATGAKPVPSSLQAIVAEQQTIQQQPDIIGPFKLDEIPTEIRDEVMKQLYEQDLRQKGTQQQNIIPQQQQPVPQQQYSSNDMAGGVAGLLSALATSGSQGIDIDDLPAEIKSEVIQFLTKQEQQEGSKQGQKNQADVVDSATHSAGGLLGSLIAGAIGGGYPGGANRPGKDILSHFNLFLALHDFII